MAYYEDDLVALHHGDALEVARGLESQSVQCIVTSPPYFGLRDYGADGQMGAESSLFEYVDAMVGLFRELRRVLADDGTLWLNIGDTYAGERGNKTPAPDNKNKSVASGSIGRFAGKKELPQKNLMGVPWRVAFGLQSDGWILRSDIIWAKPNPMPESVTDRPTKAHEYLFLLAKSPRYYYDAETIAEPVAASSVARLSQRVAEQAGSDRVPGKTNGPMRAVMPRVGGNTHRDVNPNHANTGDVFDAAKVNKRTVWRVATVPFSAAHFAVYPPELIRPCILAGSRPGDTVLDPFSGSGTTGMVATQEGRKYIGIDLNAEYLDLSLRTRFAQPVLNMNVEVA